MPSIVFRENKKRLILTIFGAVTALLFLFDAKMIRAEECDKPVSTMIGCIFTDSGVGSVEHIGNTVDATWDLSNRNACFIGSTAGVPACPGVVDNWCGDGICPSTSSGYDGTSCFIDADLDNVGINCSDNGPGRKYGKWDESQDACVTCNANKTENRRLGWSANFYCNGDVSGPEVNKCESACGASAACDESSPSTGSCDANCQWVAATPTPTPTATPTPTPTPGPCPAGFSVSFVSGSYAFGSLLLVNFNIPGGSDGCVAVYNPSDTEVWSNPYTSGGYSNTSTVSGNPAGTWKVTIGNGAASCSPANTCNGFTTVNPSATSTPTPIPTPTPTLAPNTVLGCDPGPTCGPACFAAIGSTITCSLGNATVNTICSATPSCTIYTSGMANCSCATLLAPSPSGTPGPTPTPLPFTCSGPRMFRSPITFCNVQELLVSATGWILGLVSSIIILILVIGGIMYVTSAGDEERLRQAKNMIFYAIVGLGIILISYSLIVEVKSILNIP